MRVIRSYVDMPLTTGQAVRLPERSSRHLLTTLRLRKGDKFMLFNGNGRNYEAILTSAARDHATVDVLSAGTEEPLPRLDIHLGIGISRGERMDLALQKATELGVTSLTPLLTERCVVKLDQERTRKRLAHWQAVVTSACEQSGRCRVPELSARLSLEEFIGAAGGSRLILAPDASQGLTDIASPKSQVALLVGPEGGLSANEIDAALACGFEAVRLGPRILRTETAPLAAIAAMQTLWGDFR